MLSNAVLRLHLFLCHVWDWMSALIAGKADHHWKCLFGIIMNFLLWHAGWQQKQWFKRVKEGRPAPDTRQSCWCQRWKCDFPLRQDREHSVHRLRIFAQYTFIQYVHHGLSKIQRSTFHTETLAFLQVSRLIFLIENALAILVTHLVHHSSEIGSPQVCTAL